MTNPKSPPQTLTRKELAEILKRQLGSYSTAKAVLTDYFNEIENILIEEGVVKLHNFGRFETSFKNKRMGRNPRNGEAKEITERTVVKFRPCGKLRDQVRSSLTSTDNDGE